MLSLALVALGLAAPQAASAAGVPVCAAREVVAASATWAPPLNRIISFHGSDVSLRDALDQIQARAHVRVSYSAESLPLDRQVCLALDSVPLGDVLAILLQGTGVTPVVAAVDYVVLTPPVGPVAAASNPVMLDRIVVTGTVAGASERPLPVALDVISGRDLQKQSVSSMADALNSAVPGLWMWSGSPTSLISQYGSIRGASSFGLSYPKVYIDGIEVANPLLLTRLTPDAIDRIEVIRGPQGAALYGGDGISGIANIVSRQDMGAEGQPRFKVQSDIGAAASDFASGPTLRQMHTIAFGSGSNTTSGGMDLSFGSDGAFVPGAYARYFNGIGTARSVGEKAIWTGIVRVFDEQAASPVSPVLQDSLGAGAPNGLRVNTAGTQSVVEYTAGTTLKIIPDDHWKHTFVVGVDGYTLDGLPDDRAPIPSAADSALLAARGGAMRATFRASTLRSLTLGKDVSADVSVTAEESALRQTITAAGPVPVGQPPRNNSGPGNGRRYTEPSGPDLVDWRNTQSLGGLFSTAFSNRLFLSGGLRLESATDVGSTVIPMVGGSWVNEIGPATVKLRAAYGKGVRWPQTVARETMWYGQRAEGAAIALQPEEQSGVEGGVDLMFANVLTLQLTRFDQKASGLIQRVAMTTDTASAPAPGPGSPSRQIYYRLQNVGEVSNKGWEMTGALKQGPFALTGTMSFVESRVLNLASAYAGDLKPGDRMLEVPGRTMSLTASFASGQWVAATSVYGASDWINYDRLALAQAYAGSTQASTSLVGPALRNFWRTYTGVTHARASVTFYLRPGLGWTLTGDNLLDNQTGEPDNVTVLPGRTISLGLKAQF